MGASCNAGYDFAACAHYVINVVCWYYRTVPNLGELDACFGADEEYQLFNIFKLFFICHTDVFAHGAVC